MDTESVKSDDDTLTPMREATRPAGQQQQQQQQQLQQQQQRRAAPRKSISLGARSAVLLSHSLAAGGAAAAAAVAGRRRASRVEATPTVRLENTYRMLPKPEERFARWRVRPLVLEALQDHLAGFEYPATSSGGDSSSTAAAAAATTAAAGRKACELAQAVRDRVKEAGYERYKLVVSACLFQRTGDTTATMASRAVWAATAEYGDCFVECQLQRGTVAAVATVHAFYVE